MVEEPVDYEAIERSIDIRKEFIEDACTGTKIGLSSAGLDDLDALTVALQLFRRESALHVLDLSSNTISDEGMEAVANSLAAHPELTDLYLGDNFFSSVGLIALTRSMPDLTSLDTLSLTGLNLDDDAITELASSLMAMSECHLRRLFLSQNLIADDGLLSLV
jgi:Ran GTPase-activating protein (RanGAP) involved in mRNA processing and transport